MFKIGVVTAPDGANIRQRQQAVPEKRMRQSRDNGFGAIFNKACEDLRRGNDETSKKD